MILHFVKRSNRDVVTMGINRSMESCLLLTNQYGRIDHEITRMESNHGGERVEIRFFSFRKGLIGQISVHNEIRRDAMLYETGDKIRVLI